jgi:hypothetical protein
MSGPTIIDAFRLVPASDFAKARLVKYLPRRFADTMLSRGQIRIGTLHDFRKLEHGKGIADPVEGKKVVKHDVRFASAHLPDSTDMKAVRQYAAGWNGAIPVDHPHFEMQGITLSMRFDSPDCFIYCLSDTCNSAVMSEFEGADTCVEILDVRRFLGVVTEALNSRIHVAEFLGMSSVSYQDREEQWSDGGWGVNADLIKEPSFAGQHEVRAGWLPAETPSGRPSIEPIILEDQRLTGLIREVSDIP